MNTKIIKQDTQHKHYDAMVIAVIPLIVVSSIMFGPRVILLSIIGLLTARVIDVLASMIFNTELDTSDKSSILAALVFVLMLPVSVPIHIVVVTISVTVFIGKHAFGGNGAYPFSLPALAICLAAVNWTEEVFKVVSPFTTVSFFSGEAVDFATHTTVIKQGGLPNVSLLDLLLGNYASAMGTSFVLVIIAIGIYLMVTKRISFTIPVAYLATYIIFALIFPRIYGISLMDNLILEVLTGGCVFYAFFVISEPALTPNTKSAQIVYGVLAGALGVIFTYYGAYEIGVCFAILILNAMQRAIEESVAIAGLFIKDKKSASKSVKKQESKAELKKEVAEDIEKKELVKDAPKDIKAPQTKEEPLKIKKEVKEEIKKEETKEISQSEVKEIKKEEPQGKQFPIDLISKAEDDIDEVIFSTQTFSLQELLEETRKAKTKSSQTKKENLKPLAQEFEKMRKHSKPKIENESMEKPKKPRAQKPKTEGGNTEKTRKPRTKKPKDKGINIEKPMAKKSKGEGENIQKTKKPRAKKSPNKENEKSEGEN